MLGAEPTFSARHRSPILNFTRAAILEVCPAPDILITNTGGPAVGDFRDFDREAWFKALNDNMLFAIFLIRETACSLERKAAHLNGLLRRTRIVIGHRGGHEPSIRLKREPAHTKYTTLPEQTPCGTV